MIVVVGQTTWGRMLTLMCGAKKVGGKMTGRDYGSKTGWEEPYDIDQSLIDHVANNRTAGSVAGIFGFYFEDEETAIWFRLKYL